MPGAVAGVKGAHHVPHPRRPWLRPPVRDGRPPDRPLVPKQRNLGPRRALRERRVDLAGGDRRQLADVLIRRIQRPNQRSTHPAPRWPAIQNARWIATGRSRGYRLQKRSHPVWPTGSTPTHPRQSEARTTPPESWRCRTPPKPEGPTRLRGARPRRRGLHRSPPSGAEACSVDGSRRSAPRRRALHRRAHHRAAAGIPCATGPAWRRDGVRPETRPGGREDYHSRPPAPARGMERAAPLPRPRVSSWRTLRAHPPRPASDRRRRRSPATRSRD